MRLTDFEPVRVDELAPATLASYKTKAGAAATAADAVGDRKTADKRFSGIVKATKKQFDQDAKGVSEDNLHGGRPDDEVKFFIDSEPAYYAVMDRFGDHIDFRGDDMVAPLRLWSAIQQTAGDAGGAADIAGLEDDRMGTDDELDEQGMAEGPTDDPRFQKMMGNIQKSTPALVSGYVALNFASEQRSKKIKGVSQNGKPMPDVIDNPEEFLSGKIEFTPDQVEKQLTAIGKKYGWDSIDSGQGQGYTEMFFDTSKEYTSNNQNLLAANIANTVSAINKFFNGMNSSLQATGLPGYKTDVWQGMGPPNDTNQIGDLSQIANIAKGKNAKSDPGTAIGKMILKYIPSYEAENDELGYDPEDFANAMAIAKVYIAQGEEAGLRAQLRAEMHVSEMIDELLSDAGGSGLRTMSSDDLAEGSDRIAANKQDRLQALENKLKAKGYARTKDSDGGEYQYRWTRDGAPSYVVNYRSGANGYAEFRKEQGVSEGHGNYAGDRPVNLGGVSMKKIQIGDTVRYIDQKAQVVDMSRDREHARITIPSSATTKTVLTSDLRQLGRGVQEAGYDSGDYSNDRQSDDYGRDLVPTGSGGSRFVNHGAHDHTRGRPAKTHGFSKNLPADPFGRTAGKIPHSARPKQELDPFRELDELSPATLARYKTKAGAAATAADSAGDRRTGDRRFSGIVKATKKQFDQDAKQSAQAVHESRLRLMASIIKGQ